MFTPASSKSERTHFRSALVFPAKSRTTDLIELHERHQQTVIGDDEAHYTTDGYSVDITSLISSLISRVESSVSLSTAASSDYGRSLTVCRACSGEAFVRVSGRHKEEMGAKVPFLTASYCMFAKLAISEMSYSRGLLD
jgi:hypothetical protein